MTKLRSTDLKSKSRLGAGFFGTVFLAEDELHGEVAVKVLSKKSTETDSQWDTRKLGLLSEGQRLKDSQHKNVVQVFDVRETDDGNHILLVMEYCKGGSTEDLYKLSPLSIKDTRNILSDVVLGLNALHARGMIHRDIKPGNILLTEDGTAKLSDFGLVTDEIVAGYAAGAGYLDHLPIEYHKTKRTNIKSDIWAFGMTTYRLLHGKIFYQAYPRPLNSIPDGGFAKKLEWLPHIPDQWRRFVRKCLHDNPDKRIQDSNELFSEISKLPSEPNWKCDFSEKQVKWYLKRKSREIRVRWIIHSLRKHSWSAVSLPKDGVGNKRTLHKKGEVTGKTQVLNELTKFFNNY